MRESSSLADAAGYQPSVSARFVFTHPTLHNLPDMVLILCTHGERWRQMFNEGINCYGLQHCETRNLCAFTWANTKVIVRPDQGIVRPLEPHEVYLYGMCVMEDWRGKGLAKYLRYGMYKQLEAQGKTGLYSITDTSNVAAVKFKEKLGSELIKVIPPA